jgi:uncharacterized protein YecE (DUF72 family)
MECHVGTSGWHYEHWKGLFYPADLPKTRWLDFYARRLSTVELNNTFYRHPRDTTFESWREQAPAGFLYAVKANRFITHIKRLNDIAEPLAKFLSSVRLLGNKLGPVLYQLPAGMKRDDERLEAFLSLLTGDLEHAIEFRDASWLDSEVYTMLRRHKVALCIFDMPGLRAPCVATADVTYVRFHGATQLYGSNYSEAELAAWAREILRLPVGRVYAYFNNDANAYAIANALTLEKMLRDARR